MFVVPAGMLGACGSGVSNKPAAQKTADARAEARATSLRRALFCAGLAALRRCILWCMNRTNIYLSEQQSNVLDRLAKSEGISRSELIRRLLDSSIGSSEANLEADLRAIDESFGALESEAILFDRGPGDRSRYLDDLRAG